MAAPTLVEQQYYLLGMLSKGGVGYPSGKGYPKLTFEKKLYSPDTTTGKSSFASSVFNGTNVSSRAFDNSTSTYWGSVTAGTTEYVGVDFVTPIIIGAVSVHCVSVNYKMARFALEGSDDMLNWTIVAEKIMANNNNKQFFDIDNNTAFRYWRVRNNGTTYAGTMIYIYELEMCTGGLI